MRSRSKKRSTGGMSLMLLTAPGGKVRRFELKQRHLVGLSCVWLLAMALFFSLGFFS